MRRNAMQLLSSTSLAAFFLALACLAPPAERPTKWRSIVTGRVTNSQGQPQAVLVHVLADGDIPAGDAYTDSNGNYVFMGLPNGTYTVVVEAEGYKPFRATTRLDNIVQPRGQVMVVLEPATKSAPSNGAVVAGSKSGGELNAKHPMPPLRPQGRQGIRQGK